MQNSDAPLHARGGSFFFHVCTGLPSGHTVQQVLREQRHRLFCRAFLVVGVFCGVGVVVVCFLVFLGVVCVVAGGGVGVVVVSVVVGFFCVLCLFLVLKVFPQRQLPGAVARILAGLEQV